MARVVAAGVPHHVTQRGNRRPPVFFREDDCATYLALLADEELEAIRKAGRIERPLGESRFVSRLERKLGRTLEPQKPGPNPTADRNKYYVPGTFLELSLELSTSAAPASSTVPQAEICHEKS